VPAKQRLVVLAALLRQTCARGSARAKAVVFMSSCDGVEFAHTLLAEAVEVLEGAPLLPCPIFKLHGNLPQVPCAFFPCPLSPCAWCSL
jgi:ATP-dependent RNA helicase DDX31/DBP7